MFGEIRLKINLIYSHGLSPPNHLAVQHSKTSAALIQKQSDVGVHTHSIATSTLRRCST